MIARVFFSVAISLIGEKMQPKPKKRSAFRELICMQKVQHAHRPGKHQLISKREG